MGTIRSNREKTLCLVLLALFTAVVILLQCFGGLLKLPFMGTAGNLVLVPICLGAILLGPWAGAWLGLVCGVVILIYGVTGVDVFTATLFSLEPVFTTFICLVKTTAAGAVAGLVYPLLAKKNEWLALFVAAALVPIVNTGFFVLACFCMLGALRTVGETLGALAADGSIVYFIFIGLAGVNFLFELGLNLVLTPAIERILYAVRRSLPAFSKKEPQGKE